MIRPQFNIRDITVCIIDRWFQLVDESMGITDPRMSGNHLLMFGYDHHLALSAQCSPSETAITNSGFNSAQSNAVVVLRLHTLVPFSSSFHVDCQLR